MELKLKTPTLPEVIEFNFEELKQEITDKVSTYVGMVYTDEQIKEAKSDAAKFRKFTKALSDERIRIKKEVLKPYEDFEKKVKELTGIADKAIDNIDKQIKGFEQKKKDEKREQIRALFEEMNFPEYITLEKVWDESWLNSSVSLSRIKDCLKDVAYRDEKAMSMLKDLPEFSFEAIEFYKDCFDVTLAMEKANDLARLAKAKKEVTEAQAKEKVQEEIPFDGMPEPVKVAEVVPAEDEERYWIKFSACMSVKEARELRSYFEYNKIPFKVEREEN